VNLTKIILDSDILKLIENFLPSHEDQKKLHFSVEQFPFIIETISLLDSMLPQREEDEQDLGPNSGGPSKPGADQIVKMRQKFDKERRALFSSQVL
jgi:hypothetical protein